jgi:DNA-binding beta-propeller fold protein YncE
MLLAAAAWITAGFVSFPPAEEVGAMSGVAVGSAGEVYVLHRGPRPLAAFDKDGKFRRSWGAGLFELPHGLRVAPDGTVWTTDNKNNLLRQFSAQGKLLRTITAPLKAPDDLVFASTGEIVVADAGNARIVKLSPEGKLIGSWGRKGNAPGEFAAAHGLAIDARDRIYVADRGNNRVQVFTLDGAQNGVWSGFGNPFGLLVVGKELLVSDGDAMRISHLALDSGKMLSQWGDAATLQLPHLMAIDSAGTLYVAEVNGKRVQKFRRR